MCPSVPVVVAAQQPPDPDAIGDRRPTRGTGRGVKGGAAEGWRVGPRRGGRLDGRARVTVQVPCHERMGHSAGPDAAAYAGPPVDGGAYRR